MCGFRNKKHGKKIKGTLHPTDKSDKDSFQDSPSLVFNEQPECNVSPILEEKRSESTSTGLYYCSTCGKKFSKKPYAKNHCCKAQKVFKCRKCGSEIKHASNLKRHEKKCSDNQAASVDQQDVINLTCDECGKSFSKVSNLTRHKHMIHGVAEEQILFSLVQVSSPKPKVWTKAEH